MPIPMWVSETICFPAKNSDLDSRANPSFLQQLDSGQARKSIIFATTQFLHSDLPLEVVVDTQKEPSYHSYLLVVVWNVEIQLGIGLVLSNSSVCP